MHLKRGFFRLWLALSLAFAVFVLFLMWDDLRAAFFSKTFIAHNNVFVVPVTCNNVRGKVDIDYQKIRNPWELSWENSNPPEGTIMVTDLCYYELPKFRTLYTEYSDLSDKELLAKTYQKAGIIFPSESNWEVLKRYFAIAFGIPLIFLIFGKVVAWIYLGFKNNEQTL